MKMVPILIASTMVFSTDAYARPVGEALEVFVNGAKRTILVNPEIFGSARSMADIPQLEADGYVRKGIIEVSKWGFAGSGTLYCKRKTKLLSLEVQENCVLVK